jgi:hypothetical protein
MQPRVCQKDHRVFEDAMHLVDKHSGPHNKAVEHCDAKRVEVHRRR